MSVFNLFAKLFSPKTPQPDKVQWPDLEFSDQRASAATPSKSGDVDRAGLVSLLEDLERWAAQLRETSWTQDHEVFRLRSMLYKWPVFGSQAVAEAETPEAYFDACSRLIHQTGGVIAWSGLSRTPLPESLASAMANGHGLELLGRFRSGA